MIIEITALDTLFFRDAKPFDLGEENVASGVFPPSPSVIMGAIRSAYMSQTGASINEVLAKKIQIKRVCFKIKKELFYLVPHDLIGSKQQFSADKKKGINPEAVRLELSENTSISNNSYPFLLKANLDGKVEELAGNYLVGHRELKKYLKGEEKIEVTPIADFVIDEPKIGIGIDKTTSIVEEGLLYRVAMKRMKNFSFVVEFEGLDLADQGFLKLGAEGKAVSYETLNLDYTKKVTIPLPEVKSNRIIMYVSTPTFFEEGYIPTFLEQHEVKVMTIAGGKYLSIGGFDMKNRRPKEMKRAIPAGNVYYLEFGDQNKAQEFVQQYHGESTSDTLSEEGFGIIYFGEL